MSAFRSIFMSWWMLLVALYAIQQTPNIDNGRISNKYADSFSLQNGTEAYLPGEYLRGSTGNGGYDIKTPIPDLEIPRWLSVREAAPDTEASPIDRSHDERISKALIIIFPFHEFW